jgi:hypothetical protein
MMKDTCNLENNLTYFNDVKMNDVLFGLMTISILWTYVSILNFFGFTWREKILAVIILAYAPSVYLAELCSNEFHTCMRKNT